MHGRVQNYGQSCSRSLRRISTQHMRSVLPLATTTKKSVAVVGDRHCSLPSPVSTSTVTDSSFVKDGRKIKIGDCALFKPPQDCPPFIGLIRSLHLNKESILQLEVNWLYRPSELKLGKGTLINSAPNEIFYSFHKDETPAASLLHPCKVAFLPQGVELPTGTSSFVCRRVYDIANKCLWWLTDQNFINERQEEVDQLLYKTRTEMHATLQPDGRSPKQVNGPNSTSQLKPASDSGQNGGTFPSQVKGKKRERVDHGSDPIKRGRSSRTDGGDLHPKSEYNLKLEIARITEKGGLVDLEGVDKLVQLMQPDRPERKLELVSRSMLAGVMAATEKVDCLNRFVQLRGLPILDEWLQDIHKGRLGDGNSSKDGDKFGEEFLLVLLRALDKLPVNLHALQMCNIGRSVNHLRSHKNLEIQRKARSLVDLWKKRVEAEMISIDAKNNSTHTAAWASKSRQPEASHGGSRTPSGSDVGIKSSITQNSASKTTSARSSHGENNMKSATSSPGPGKPASSAAPKESQPRISIGDAPLIREDRSSSSNQSHNYSQTSSGKEDGKTSAAGSAAVIKISNSSTRNRRSSGFPTSATGSHKESSSIRSSAHRTVAPDKLTQPGFNSSDRALEGVGNEGSGHKLIVKIPNRVQSPAQGVGGGSLEDPAVMSSRVSSPILTDKHDQSDHTLDHEGDMNRIIASETNVGPCQNNTKNVPTGSAEGAGLSAASDEEHKMSIEDPRRSMDAPPTNQWNSGKLHAFSFSPMNALIESCAKYSEANSSMSLEDEVGMNLLASVAAGEISRSTLASPTGSTERSVPAVDGVCNGDEAKSKSSPEENTVRVRNDFPDDAECDKNKHAVVDACAPSEDRFSLSKSAPNGISGDKMCNTHKTSGDAQGGEHYKQLVSSNTHFRTEIESAIETTDRSNEKSSSLSLSTSGEKVRDVNSNEEIHKKLTPCAVVRDGILNCKSDGFCAVKVEAKTSIDMFNDKDKQNVEVEVSNQQHAAGVSQSLLTGELNMGTSSLKICNSAVVKDEFAELSSNEKLQPIGCGKVESGVAMKIGESGEDIKGCINKSVEEKHDSTLIISVAGDNHGMPDICTTSDDAKNHHKDDDTEKKGIPDDFSDPRKGSAGSVYHEPEKECGSTCNPLGETVECGADASSSAAEVSDLDSKVKFDLNEGFNVDDGKYGDSVNVLPSVATNAHPLTTPFPMTSTPNSHPASITVAAPAKGPFVPPEDLLRSKGELGWKGSAATSAFRPAEPRKVSEASLVSATSPEASTSKPGRVFLDIDLNVPDERVLEEMASREFALPIESRKDNVTNCAVSLSDGPVSVPIRTSSRLDFDLNTVDEANDIGYPSTSTNHKGEVSALSAKPSGPSLPSVDMRRDFDLNDGPGVDDNSTEQFQISHQMKEGVPPHLSSAGLRVNSPGLGNISSWFLPGSTYSTVAVPSMLPDRGEQRFSIFPSGGPQRPFGPSGVNPFTSDVYRGSVLPSSPAMPLQPSPFQFPMFPFGATYPLSSATFPVGATSYSDSISGTRLFAPQMNPQFQVPVASVTSQFQRPFKVNLPDNRSSDGSENYRRWGRQGLDLNSGPGIVESDVREEMLPSASGQHSITSSQALAEEHARMYSVSGGTLKRKEPEGSWENEFRYKQSSWQ